MRLQTTLVLALLALPAAVAVPTAAQDPASDNPVRHGLSIGDYPNVSGLRINFRDRRLGIVRGANVTIWSPYEGDPGGIVRGFAIGLPSTGAGSVHGVAIGLLGAGVTNSLTGIGFAPVGIGAGGRIKGIAIGGVGVGGGGDIEGIAIGGVGAGVGGTLRGLAVGGVGLGAGRSIEGIAIAGGAVGAPTIHAFALASFIGATHMNGLMIAPVMARLEPGGSMRGVSVSGFNYMRGEQRGLTIGLINYARDLEGMQIGVINIARNASVKFLPIINYHKR